MESTKKPRTITFSFNEESKTIIVKDISKSDSLNDLTIDLTGDSSEDEEEKEKPGNSQNIQPKKAVKTIEFNMSISDCIPPSKKIFKNDINNNSIDEQQPTCSKYLNPCKTNFLDKISVNGNPEDFICPLCFKLILKKNGMTLKECRHKFCRQCLIQCIQNNHDEMTGSVKCPEGFNCHKNLNNDEIKELLGANYEVFLEQIKYNIEQFQEREERFKESEVDSLLPAMLSMDLDIIPNTKKFECQVCFDQIEIGEGVKLYNCLHEFCRECLNGQILVAEDFEVKCPLHDISCKDYLREREVKALVSNENFEKHLQKSLKLAENGNELAFHCRTPDCPIFIELAEEVHEFKCPKCLKVNCIKCKAIHAGKSCVDYQEEMNPQLKTDRLNNENFQSEDTIKQLIATNQAMYCPKCSIPVMKVSGCDFISCSACKLGICWVTKKPRNDLQKANGTIIQGCRCKGPPKYQPCHPKCSNCH